MSQPKGQIVHTHIDSQLLSQGKLAMPVRRPLVVYTPPSSIWKGEDLPTLYCLASWTSAGRAMMQWSCFREPLNERLDRLILSEQIPPCVVVCPDLYTEYGGSQYINSDYMGPHGDHVVHEVIPHIEKAFPVKKGAEHRGVFGISSGGFGAIRFGMDYSNAFASVASHSGDLGFDIVYGADLTTLANGLAAFDGDVAVYLEACRKKPKMSGRDFHIHMLIGMCAFYSPNLSSELGFDLPIDVKTCVRNEGVWKAWLKHDPVERVTDPEVQERLRSLKMLYIECGYKDQYNLHYGARQFDQRLQELDIDHEFAEFDDNHSGLAYRFDTSLPKLLAPLV